MYIYNAVAYKWNKHTSSRVHFESVLCSNPYVAKDVISKLVRVYSDFPDMKFDVERLDVLESSEDYDFDLSF